MQGKSRIEQRQVLCREADAKPQRGLVEYVRAPIRHLSSGQSGSYCSIKLEVTRCREVIGGPRAGIEWMLRSVGTVWISLCT